MRRLSLPVAVLALAACATGATREQVLAQYVGAPEAQLVQGLGVPTRTYTTGELKFLAYDEQRTTVLPGAGSSGLGWGWYDPFPPAIVTSGCETTFEVASGRVRSFTLRGDACG